MAPMKRAILFLGGIGVIAALAGWYTANRQEAARVEKVRHEAQATRERGLTLARHWANLVRSADRTPGIPESLARKPKSPSKIQSG